MGFVVNKKTKTIHKENCSYVKNLYEKNKNKKNSNYDYYKTQKKAEQYFITKDNNYKLCKFCMKNK